MSKDLTVLLNQYRNLAKDQRQKGTYFELLIKDFLKNDPPIPYISSLHFFDRL